MPSHSVAIPLPALRILVVEDEPLQRFSVEETLAEMGVAAVFGAGTEEQALALLERKRIDLAVLDVHLDDQPRLQLAHILISRDIPLVFLTGSQGEEIRQPLRDGPFVGKPFGDDMLIGPVLSALANAPTVPA